MMIVRSSIARFALVSLLPVAGQANEALKLLEQEADSSKNIYEEAAELAVPRKDVKVAEEKVESVDPFLSERWGTELDPKFPIQAGRETRVAPRGLFEYQHQDRSVGGGTKLGRARVGAAVETLYGIELQADALLSSSGKYEGWETLKASVPVGQSARLHVGKLPLPFSTEYSRDAAVRWFPTLSPFAAQLAPASTTGAMFEGRTKQGDWKLGWFGSEADRSLPVFEGKGALLVSLARSHNKGGRKERRKRTSSDGISTTSTIWKGPGVKPSRKDTDTLCPLDRSIAREVLISLLNCSPRREPRIWPMGSRRLVDIGSCRMLLVWWRAINMRVPKIRVASFPTGESRPPARMPFSRRTSQRPQWLAK